MDEKMQADIRRAEYFQALAETITEWESDPKGYDLKLVAHELQKITGRSDADPSGLPPGEFVALLGRCKRRGANPPEPVPPQGAIEWRKELHRFALEEKDILLMAREEFFVPAQYRGPYPHEWKAVEPKAPGDATSRAVIFDRPPALTMPGELLTIVAEMGLVPGAAGQRQWYRLYYTVKLPKVIDVQILAEGTTVTVGGARAAMGRKLNLFLSNQCECEPLPDEEPPPSKTRVYLVQVPVRLGSRDATELSKYSHQAELSAVVTNGVQRYARQMRELREERAAARRARQAARAQTAATNDTTRQESNRV